MANTKTPTGRPKKFKKLVIGIDQSYENTGVAFAADGELIKTTSIRFKGAKNNTEKRNYLMQQLRLILSKNRFRAKEVIIICERIRTFSKGFISTNYIKSTGALIAKIVDTAYDYGVEVYSVDTRSWKAQVVGTTKGGKENTIEFVQNLGFDLYVKDDKDGKPVYNDDAADAACIALYGFIDEEKQKLQLEK